jgi:hypothetical protein
LAGIIGQYNHTTIVVGVDDGFDTVATKVRRGIDMRQKSHHGGLFIAGGGRDSGEHIAMSSDFDITGTYAK